MTPNETNATQVATQPAMENETALKKMSEKTITQVMDRVQELQESGQLTLPSGYHYGNAIKSAWLYLQDIETRDGRKAISVCNQTSICNCLLQMTINGEHPGKHCYFIPTGNTLSFWEKYTGKLMRAKRDAGLAECNAQVVYEGDEFTYTIDDNGQYQMVSHKTKLENINIDKIRAAYAVVVMKDGTRHLEVMTMEQIKKSWGMGAAKGASKAHTQFTDQMAKRTIINRACKVILESHSEAYNDLTNGDMYDDGMQQPNESEALRQQANNQPMGGGNAYADAATFAEPDDYEDVTDGGQQEQQAQPAQPAQTTAKNARKCPI